MVEGGAGVIGALLEWHHSAVVAASGAPLSPPPPPELPAVVVAQVVVTVAPCFLLGHVRLPAPHAVQAPDLLTGSAGGGSRLVGISVALVGGDVVVQGALG